VCRSAKDKFGLIAHAAPRTDELHHQCAIPAAPASSINRPLANRSSWKGSANS
jgi:hypothetical protein